MHPSSLFALLSLYTVAALAAPAATTTTCPVTSTYTAKFDSLPTGSPVPANRPYRGASWSGFTVEPASNYGYAAASGSNVVVGNTQGSYFSIQQTGSALGSLTGFEFSCAYYFYQAGYYPDDCDVLVVTQPVDDHVGQITSLGPFSAKGACYDQSCSSYPSNMTKVTKEMLGGGVQQAYFYFYVTSGHPGDQILLDNVIFEVPNYDC